MEESGTSKTGGGRGLNFSLHEDENLCKAWAYVKDEMLIGLTKKGSFWERIIEVYNEGMGATTHRSYKALHGRWCTIQQNLSMFCVCLELETRKDATASLETRVAAAKREFYTSRKFAFKWDDCWEILKDNTHWKNHLGPKLNITEANKNLKRSKLDITDADKRMKLTMGNDSIDFECASLTPTTLRLQPTTPTLVPFAMNTNLVSSGPMKEKESEKKDEEQTVHLSKFVDETNSLWKTFMSSVDERLGKIEGIARRNLQLKEEKIRLKQLEMRESQFERDKQLMDMDLEHMPIMKRQFYELKQREICERWKMGEPISAGEGSSGELECVGDPNL
ncbi:hypothetical protein ACHQM5_004149 [Ranunculus cassubicifolius]